MKTGQFQLSRLENQSNKDLYFKNQNGEVNKVAISSNLLYLATFHATRERQVKIWDLKEQKLIKEENTSPYCTRLEVLEFSYNNEELYIIEHYQDALVMVNITSNQEERCIELEERCQGFKISQDKYYACQFLSGNINFNIWDLRTEQIVNSLNYQSDARIVACFFLRESKIITLSTYEEDYKLFQLWDLKKNQIIKSKRDVFISCYPELFVHDNIMIVHYTADEMSFIEMWYLSTFTKIRKVYQELFGFYNLRIYDYQVIGQYNKNFLIEDPFNFERFVRYDQGFNDNNFEENENDIEEEFEENMNDLPQIHQNQNIENSDHEEIENQIDEENQNESNQNSHSDIQNQEKNVKDDELNNEEELNENSSQQSEDEQHGEEIQGEQLQFNQHHQGIEEENNMKSHSSMSQSKQNLDDNVEHFQYGCLNIITLKNRIRKSKILKLCDTIIFFEQGFLYHDNVEQNFQISLNVGEKQ